MLEIAFTPEIARRDPDRYLDYALALPGRIAKADGKRVVVFFDEFQEIAGSRALYGDPDAVTKRMRAIFQRSPEVSVRSIMLTFKRLGAGVGHRTPRACARDRPSAEARGG